jgi:hypothetical protein
MMGDMLNAVVDERNVLMVESCRDKTTPNLPTTVGTKRKDLTFVSKPKHFGKRNVVVSIVDSNNNDGSTDNRLW